MRNAEIFSDILLHFTNPGVNNSIVNRRVERLFDRNATDFLMSEFESLEQEIDVKSALFEKLKKLERKENLEKFDNYVLESVLLKSEEGILCFMRLFLVALRERPLAIQKYSDFLVRICEACPLAREVVASRWLTNLFHTPDFAAFEPQILFVVNQLVHRAVIPEERVTECVCGMYEDYFNRTETRDICTCYFGPEVQKNERIWDEYVLPMFEHPQVALSIRDMASTWFAKSELMENDWQLWREMRLKPWGFSEMVDVMMHDDVGRLRELAEYPEFDVDGRLARSAIVPFDYLRWRPPYVGVAAFFRATKCYQFLVSVGADIGAMDESSHTVAQFAASSGCLEILRDLEQRGDSLEGVLQVSAGFSRYDIFDWKRSSTDIGQTLATRTNVISQAAIENNMWLMRTCIEEGADVNVEDTRGRYPLYKALLYNNIEVAKMLMDCERIVPRDELLPLTAHYSDPELLDYLMDRFGESFSDDVILSAVRAALDMGQVGSAEVLMKRRKDLFDECIHLFVRELAQHYMWWILKRELCRFLWAQTDSTDKLILLACASQHMEDRPLFFRFITSEHGHELQELLTEPPSGPNAAIAEQLRPFVIEVSSYLAQSKS